jgi:3-deoxy-D-manno-octulosonic-acid transferase
LEPAAWGLPVLFGAKWTKFREAASLIRLGAAFPVGDADELAKQIKKLCSDSDFRTESGNLAVSYMKSQMGSTDLIIRYLLGKW